MSAAEPLVRPLGDGDVPAELRPLLQANTEKGYQDASFMRLLAHRPEILSAFVTLSKAFFFGRESTVEHRLKELIRLRIAAVNACHY